MTVEVVTDVFEFVAAKAEFTKSILFAHSEVPEIRDDEREAIAAVLAHVEASYLGILNTCRDNMFNRADAELQATMKRNWNRDTSIWARGRVELPLLIQASYVAVAYFWIDDEPSRPGCLSLVGELWAQARKREPLLKLPAKAPVFFTPGENLRVLASELKTGKRFTDLAEEVVDPLWPLAVDLRAALLDQAKSRTE